MCGIFGLYDRTKNISNASEQVLNGLRQLDYRGYDSWGIASLTASKNSQRTLSIVKDVGSVPNNNSVELPVSWTSIGHTRWATHGAVSKKNAHPHLASDGSFALAQNGIVQNFEELKERCKEMHYVFNTETDTEVIVRLIELENTKYAEFDASVWSAFRKLEGRNTILILTKNGEMFGARNGSPLILGKSKNQKDKSKIASETYYFSSDVSSLPSEVQEYYVLKNGEGVVLSDTGSKALNIASGKEFSIEFERNQNSNVTASKGNFDHFMIKEIFDTPSALFSVTKQKKGELNKLVKAIENSNNVYTIGSGTAGFAAQQIAYYLREIAKIQVQSLIGAECESYVPLFQKNDVIIAPSQSGETADVLEVLESAKSRGMIVATYVNMLGSMMTSVADVPLMANAGPERCVMSTKVFSSQIAFGYVLAKTAIGQYEQAIAVLHDVAYLLDELLQDASFHKKLVEIAEFLAVSRDIFLLGKGKHLSIVQEGMVKIIEGSYKHAHGIPAGDLKHYAITIIEKGVPVIFSLSNDRTKSDVLNAVHEVKARGATVIGVGSTKGYDFDIAVELPDLQECGEIINGVVMQLIAYYLTVALGHNVDKPRNIAKSVTVK